MLHFTLKNATHIFILLKPLRFDSRTKPYHNFVFQVKSWSLKLFFGIFFCILQSKETQSGLEEHEGEYMLTDSLGELYL